MSAENQSCWPFTNESNCKWLNQAKHWPRISIITPSFNQGDFIEETILSVLHQNYPNLEYLIIDGGSTDNTTAVVSKYQQEIAAWVSEPDNGQSSALNKGLKLATGEIIGYLNSDDCLLPDALFLIAEAFRTARKTDPIQPMIFSGHALIGEALQFCTTTFESKHGDWSLAGIAEGYGICPQPSTFWTAGPVYFDEQLRFCMDFDYWVRLVHQGYKLVRINQILSFYRLHPAAKGNTLTDIMWLESAALTFEHAKLAKDIQERFRIVNSYKYKLGNYFFAALQKERLTGDKQNLLKLTIGVMYQHSRLCAERRFIKFLVALIFQKKKQ